MYLILTFPAAMCRGWRLYACFRSRLPNSFELKRMLESKQTVTIAYHVSILDRLL